ncbi:hypothetical protein H8356DRAFT_1432279 [Neocallimastix lanati (nom. inval.)]|nr:hypothetical protein H8356DRAFT_1432279 [Neocallimastix sp. JGI-2020a]
MLKFTRALLLVISSLSIVNSQLAGNRAGVAGPTGATGATDATGATGAGLAGAAGTCSKIVGSTMCPDFPDINVKVTQIAFDNLVQAKYDLLKGSLKGMTGTTCATYDSSFSSSVRYLKSYACSLVLKEQGCSGNSVLCPRICSDLNTSLTNMGCVNTQAQAQLMTKCNSISVNLSNCIDSTNSEIDTCGLEDQTAKAAYCSQHPTLLCCKGSTGGAINNVDNMTGTKTVSSTTTTESTATATQETTKTKSDSDSKKSNKKGSFFTSKIFLIILGFAIVVIGILGFFYYLGAKDEKEEMMRGMENGNNGNLYQNNNYGTQTVEVNKNQNFNTNLEVNNNNDYTVRSPYDEKPSYAIPTSSATSPDPFADSNQVDPISPYNTTYNSGYDNSYGYNNDYNNMPNQNQVSYQNPSMVAAAVPPPFGVPPPAPVENPFDAPEAVIPQNDDENKLDKSMQELSKNFAPDDMPVPSVVKMTSIETPQQGNTKADEGAKNNENDDILKPSMVRMTNIETPVPTNTIPSEKNINIGDDILKPSMVTLTEIKTPQETSFNDEKEKAKEAENEEPKKAVVNMIDLKTPDSNEALNTGSLLTPSIMITNTDGQTTDAGNKNETEEALPEEYSEMPDPRPFRCIHPYEPQIDDELRLDLDNEIDVLYEYDDGWCWAINKTTGEQGACPLLCLLSIQEEAKGDREWEKEMDVMKVPGRRESMLSNSFDTSRYSLNKTK